MTFGFSTGPTDPCPLHHSVHFLTTKLSDTLLGLVTMRLLPFFTLLAGVFEVATAASDASAPNVVDLGYVKYRGNLSYPDTVAYLGVPYAEPPVGERRWRAPLALNTTRISSEAGSQVVNLTTNPDFCIQGTTGGQSSHI